MDLMYTHSPALATTTHTTAHTPDPIALHMQALNSLSRCKAMLTAREPMYGFALQDLAAAQQAIAALSALVQPLED
ncbi:hypothetical protein [Comamonas kerstersii]|uniref:hypothetical protein n=1 Tax=Comamonas kerstersii TaxID=225992 RepID=UPI00106405FE|nr:hypothetical protein [Comamonas kerstersii]